MEKKTPVWRVTSKGDAHFKKIRAVPSTQAERLADLAAAGLVTLASGKELEPFEPLRSLGRSLSETLLEERNDRF